MPLDHDSLWDAMVHELEPNRGTKVSAKTLTETCTRVLRRVVRDGSLVPGEKLPGEHDLAQVLGISRATVREALRSLEAERLIVRRRGAGTVVLPELIRNDLSRNFGITAMIHNAGKKEETGDATVTCEHAPAPVAKALELPEGADVLKLDRVRLVGGHPIVWSLDWLPADTMRIERLELLIGTDSSSPSIYDFLRNEADRSVVRGIAELRATTATGKVAHTLQLKKGSAVMEMTQTDFDRDDRPIIFSVEHHVPDAFQFHIQRLGPFS